MTDGYGFYFASAVQDYEKKIVFEIDLDRLDQRLMLPDEDFLHQLTWAVLRSNGGELTDKEKKRWHENAVQNLEKYVLVDQGDCPSILLNNDDGNPAMYDEMAFKGLEIPPSWQVSLKYISTCCYKGTIPPSAITRYCIFSQQERPLLAALSYNEGPHLTPDCRQRNEHARNLTKWFFGDRKKLPRYDHSTVSKYRKKLEEAGEIQRATTATGSDNITRRKPERKDRPKSTPKEVPQAAAEAAEATEPKSVTCDPPPSSIKLAETQEIESVPEEPTPETWVGCLESSAVNLKLVKTVSERDGYWEWMAQDDQGNSYHLTCKRMVTVVLPTPMSKVG